MQFVLSVPLSVKATSALVGRSTNTLLRARHDRPDIDMPPARRVGSRGVAYLLGDIVAWAERRGLPLHWAALPFSFLLESADAFDAEGFDVPLDLQTTLGRVKSGLASNSGRRNRPPNRG
jgi:predicted DNA-binding transcriptional regulator AlpA